MNSPRPFSQALALLAAAKQAAKERKQLAGLDDHELRDIGIPRDQANAEARRSPFDLPSRLDKGALDHDRRHLRSLAHTEHKDNYLELAYAMRKDLEQFDGFISVERFESLTEPGKLLSLSTWRDEEALNNWRKLAKHRQMQKLGRSKHFANYRLRVATVIRDYGLDERDEAPEDSREMHG